MSNNTSALDRSSMCMCKSYTVLKFIPIDPVLLRKENLSLPPYLSEFDNFSWSDVLSVILNYFLTDTYAAATS